MSLMRLLNRSEEKTHRREDCPQTLAWLRQGPFLASARELLASGCIHGNCRQIHSTLIPLDGSHHEAGHQNPRLCHPERSEGSLAVDEQGSLATLGMAGYARRTVSVGNGDHARQPTRVTLNPLLRSLLTTYRWLT